MGTLIFLIFVFFILIPKLQQKKAQQEKMRRDYDAARRAEAAVRAAQNTAQSAAAAQRAAEQNAAAARRAQNADAYPPPTRQPKYQQGAGAQGESLWTRVKNLKGEQDAQTLSLKKTLGVILGAVGGGLSCLFGLGTLLSVTEFIESLSYGYFFADELTISIVSALVTAGGLFLVRTGAGVYRRAKNFEWYRAIIGERRECPITDIARATGRGPQKVLRDLQELVRNGYFPLGFADVETGCFYADNDAYRERNPEKAKWEDSAVRSRPVPRPQPAAQPTPQPEPAPAQAGALSDAQLREYKRRMEQIQDPALHEKAARLYEHAEDIFAWVQLHPECTDDVRRFCSYYLPTANKLLATYNEIAPHKNDSQVAANIESEVSRVLDTMTTAFRGLMDNLLQNTAVDMQAEISALETVLAQEGLTQNGLTLQ